MNRTINPKAILVILAIGIVLGFAVHFVHAYQIKRNAGELLEEATRAEGESRPERAIELLTYYLGLRPNDVDALERYGYLLDKLGKSRLDKERLALVLEKALLLDPHRTDIRRKAVENFLVLGRYRDARAHLDILRQEMPDDANIEELYARCEEGVGHYPDAAQWYAKAIRHAPENFENYVRFADLLRRRLEDPKAADRQIRKMRAANLRSLEARLAAIEYEKQYGQLAEALKDIDFALKQLDANRVEVFVLAAEVAEAAGQQDLGHKYLESGLKRYPGNLRLNLALARLEILENRRSKALARVQPALKALPEDANELAQLASVLIEGGMLDEASRVIDRLPKKGLVPIAEYLRAFILVKKGQWGPAREALESILARLVHWPRWFYQANLLLADCYAQLGSPDQELVYCRHALQIDPVSKPARLRLISALLKVGKLDEGIEAYRRIEPKSPEDTLALCHLLIRRSWRFPVEERNGKEVEALLAGLPEPVRSSLDAQLVQVDLLLAAGKPEDAWKLMEAECNRQPKQVRAWLALATLADQNNEPETFARVLEQAKQHLGHRPEWQLAWMRHWIKVGGSKGRKALLELEPTLESFTANDQQWLRRALAEAYYRLGESQAAARIWRRLADQDKDDLNVRLLLFDLALVADNNQEMARLLQEIKQIEGEDGPFWAYGEAARLITLAAQGKKTVLEEARSLAARAGKQRPNWPAIPVLEARIEELQQHRAQALEKYQHAIELGERRPSVIRQTVDLLYQLGRYTEAQEVMNKLPEQALISSDLGRRAAELSLLNQDQLNAPDRARAEARALELARQAVPANSKNYRDYLWLGHIARQAHQPAEAKKMLRQAVTMAENVPETWVTWILFLASTDHQEALAAIAEAHRKLPPKQAPLALAICYEATGQLDKAKEQYAVALAADPGDVTVLHNVANFYLRTGDTALGQAYLRKILEPKTKATDRVVAWARRTLASSLAGTGNYQQFREALDLIDQNLQKNSASSADLHAKAMVLATRSDRRREAIALYESLGRDKTQTPNEQFLLAQLYEADGAGVKARNQMLTLLSSRADNPLYSAYYIHLCLAGKEYLAAEVWLNKLAKIEPKSARLVGLRARLLNATNRQAEAVRSLQKLAEEHPEQLAAVADTLESLGHPAEAEKAYRDLVKKSTGPERVLMLADFLGRQKRTTEALDLCQQAWKTCRPEAVAASAVAMLRQGQAGPKEFQRVKQWLSEASHSNANALVILKLQAELHELEHDYSTAMKLHRQVLQANPQDIVSLNNLAWLLALTEGNKDEALQFVNKAIDLAGPLDDLLDTRAVIYLRQGQSGPALNDMEAIVRPSSKPSFYFHLAQAYLLARDRERAAQTIQQANGRGLKAASLHPLEQKAYKSLLLDLNAP